MKRLLCLITAAMTVATVGCRSMYYSAWEKMGKQKRHLLKDNVEAARDDQQEASAQFKDALTQLKEIYSINGGELEAYYRDLEADYNDCRSRAEDVRGRISKIERVAEDLFKEWEAEINQISSANLRRGSRRKLTETRRRYGTMIQSMRRAELRMGGVLTKLKDQVLYVKHNLNAQAIGALKTEAGAIEKEIAGLINEMNRSIAEADKFIQGL